MDYGDFFQACVANGSYAKLAAASWVQQTHEGGGFTGYWRGLRGLAEQGQGSLLAAIHQATPDENPLKSTTHYLMSGLAAHEGDIHACKGHLHQAMILIQKHLAELATDEDAVHAIKSIMKQYALITPMIDTSAVPATVLGLDGVEAPDSSRGFFVFSSCNGTYFDRFGEAFVRSVCGRADAPACHLHIINPPWDSQPDRDALQKRYPALAITTEQGPQEATYYACRRFQVVASLIRHYRKAALVSDIDVVLTPAIRAFDDVGSTVAGVFKKSDLDPMLIMHLSLSYWACDPVTLSFADDVDRYLSHHMAQGYVWTLDQCAYLTCALRCQASETAFSVVDLAQVLGADLGQFQVNQPSSTDEKYDMRGHEFR